MRQTKLPYVGALKEVLSHTTLWMGIINFTLLSITAYWTTLKMELMRYFPWVQFWMFFGSLLLILLTMMVLEYKFIMPSYYSFRGGQFFKHDQTVRKLLEEILKELRKEEDESRNNSTHKPT